MVRLAESPCLGFVGNMSARAGAGSLDQGHWPFLPNISGSVNIVQDGGEVRAWRSWDEKSSRSELGLVWVPGATVHGVPVPGVVWCAKLHGSLRPVLSGIVFGFWDRHTDRTSGARPLDSFSTCPRVLSQGLLCP